MKAHQKKLVIALVRRLRREVGRRPIGCCVLESSGIPDEFTDAEDLGYARDRINEAIDALEGRLPRNWEKAAQTPAVPK